MTSVQIAIEDRTYAAALCDALEADGKHSVQFLDYPRPDLAGVVVADEKLVDRLMASQRIDLNRCVIFVRQLDFDANRLFAAGVRHLIHADSPADLGRLIVIAAEKKLTGGGAHPPEFLLNATDKLFLQSLGIGAR
jgi:hypothetical protein